MDEESGERQLWQNAYSFIADRVRGIVTHRRIQHVFQQMRDHFDHNRQDVQRQCEVLESGPPSGLEQNLSGEERMTEQRQFVLSSEENQVDYMATAAAECEMTSGEAGCSCLIDLEEDQEGRAGLFASGTLPFSSCTVTMPEGTGGRGGAAAPLVARTATAFNPGKPTGGHGNNVAEVELVNSRQNEGEIDGLGDEERWAKLQQQPGNHHRCRHRNNINQVAGKADGCNAAASALSLVTELQGNPNMTSLISASTPPSAQPSTTAASAQLSCNISRSNDDYAGRANDTSLGHTASCVSMDTGVATTLSGSTLGSSEDSASMVVDEDTGYGNAASNRQAIQLGANQSERSVASHIPLPSPPPIDPDNFNREHNEHTGAVENSEHMAQTSAACSAGHSQTLHNSPFNTQETNQYFHTAEAQAVKNTTAVDQTMCFNTHVPNDAEPLSVHNVNDLGYAGASIDTHSCNFGAVSDSNSCAQLSEGSIRETAGGYSIEKGGWYVYRGRESGSTITFPIDKVSHAHNGNTVYGGNSSNHFNNDAGSSVLSNRDPLNEMVVDCYEQSLENHDAAPLNICPDNSINSVHGGRREEQSNINVVTRDYHIETITGSDNFQPNRQMEAQVMVVLDDLEHSMGTSTNSNANQQVRPRRKTDEHCQFRKRKKCTDVCHGHDVIFPSEMNGSTDDRMCDEGASTAARSTCCSSTNDIPRISNPAMAEAENNLNHRLASNRYDHGNSAMDVDLDQVDGAGDGDMSDGAYGGGDVDNVTGGLINSLDGWTAQACSGSSSTGAQMMHGHLTELDQTDIFRELDAMCQCSIQDILTDNSSESQADNLTNDLHRHVRQQSGNQGNCRHNTSDDGAVSSNTENDSESRQQRHSTSHSPTQSHSRPQFRFGLPNLNLVQLFRNLLRNFYYETFIWMYLSVVMHPRSSTTRNRLRFLGLLSNQSMESVLLNVLLGYFNGFHAGREATIRESCRVLGEISGRGGGYVSSRQSVWLRELSIDIGIHYNPRQMLRAFSGVVREILMTRVPPVYCVRYVGQRVYIVSYVS